MLTALFLSLALTAAPQDTAAIEEAGLCFVGAKGMRTSIEADIAAGNGQEGDAELVTDLSMVENRSGLRLSLLTPESLPEGERQAIDDRVKARLDAMSGDELYGLMDACWNWLGLST